MPTAHKIYGNDLDCSIPEHCIDARRLPLFTVAFAIRELIAGLRKDKKVVLSSEGDVTQAAFGSVIFEF